MKEQSFPGQIVRTVVVGTTFQGRQRVVAQLALGEQVQLVREPTNPHDQNAILVVRRTGAAVGYINRHSAAALAPHFDACGRPVSAVVITLAWNRIHEVTIGFVVPAPAADADGAKVPGKVSLGVPTPATNDNLPAS